MPHPLEAVEEWRERAAIMEYEGGMTREDAEQAATDRVTRLTKPQSAVEQPVVDEEQRQRMLALCVEAR